MFSLYDAGDPGELVGKGMGVRGQGMECKYRMLLVLI